MSLCTEFVICVKSEARTLRKGLTKEMKWNGKNAFNKRFVFRKQKVEQRAQINGCFGWCASKTSPTHFFLLTIFLLIFSPASWYALCGSGFQHINNIFLVNLLRFVCALFSLMYNVFIYPPNRSTFQWWIVMTFVFLCVRRPKWLFSCVIFHFSI